MKRSGFKRRPPAELLAEAMSEVMTAREIRPRGKSFVHSLATPQRGRMARIEQAAPVVSTPKERPKRSKRYARWVASLPCAHCGIAGRSQAAHADQGKGERIKASDETLFPACADEPLRRGCHSVIGDTGQLGKEKRRQLEGVYGLRTRRRARAAGVYPAGWRED